MNARFSVQLGDRTIPAEETKPEGQFCDREGERYYVIRDADGMPPFFTCVVSDSDHFLFASSNGSLTCGRRNSSGALFPYATEDKIRDNVENTGPYTALLVDGPRGRILWEPFRPSSSLVHRVSRHLYKNALGNKLAFEEINHDLGLKFTYEWCTSSKYGFVRRCRLDNERDATVEVSVLDGVQNILPACVDPQMQLEFSCLLDAYKQNEQVGDAGLGVYSFASQITDKAEPQEALRASVAWGWGLEEGTILLTSEQLARFVRGQTVHEERAVRGRRGAFFRVSDQSIEARGKVEWGLVLDVNQSQGDVAGRCRELEDPAALVQRVKEDIQKGSRVLRGIVARTDGLQLTADEATTTHHFANTLFNDMRGGVYHDDYRISAEAFAEFVRAANRVVWEENAAFFESLPREIAHAALIERVAAWASKTKDASLVRLGLEYLPLTFSRRHGDPSRPWNKFDIKVRDEEGRRLLGFQGNWRDIFQNWEALSVSYPGYVESLIAKFVNASTVDGHNPYRITDSGMDWEVPEPDNPWAGIGYWGDHQIIYLLKLLEQSRAHHPERLSLLLLQRSFSYANVPYRIKPFDGLVATPRDTIQFSDEVHREAMERSEQIGFDGKLILKAQGARPEVLHVTLLEKLLVASLAKMGNFVPEAGIWMNTQRPEWNDANNALVGSGVSMVTLYYLTRYFEFLGDLVDSLDASAVELSAEVADWLEETCAALASFQTTEGEGVGDEQRRATVERLGRAFGDYRAKVYEAGLSEPRAVQRDRLRDYVREARRHLIHSVRAGRRSDGLYHAYNLLTFKGENRLTIEPLYEMLEGQVATLSAGVLTAGEAADLLDTLRKSAMYRPDQDSYMLYPDRSLPGFMEKNRARAEDVARSRLLSSLLERGSPILRKDATGQIRFGADLINAGHLREALLGLVEKPSDDEIEEALAVYESTFDHHAFTGRSGTMFGYEGLGSIYWHMVAKLLLAVQENHAWAIERGADARDIERLASHYYEIRAGVGGFNKTPEVYGAFPMDPYSHTPERSGARQPGMTGQVKEEVLTRFGELGVEVRAGKLRFDPVLLRKCEFVKEQASFEMVSLSGEPTSVPVPEGSLAFSYCQVPVVYRLSERMEIIVHLRGGERKTMEGCELSEELTASIFERREEVERLEVFVRPGR